MNINPKYILLFMILNHLIQNKLIQNMQKLIKNNSLIIKNGNLNKIIRR